MVKKSIIKIGAVSALALSIVSFEAGVSSAFAQETAPVSETIIPSKLVNDIKALMKNEVVPISINAANVQRKGISEAEILKLDDQWRTESKSNGAQPLIATTLGSPLSTYLLRVQAGSFGLYNEIFVMDANGLNVGQSAITSDYWQGDEAKVQKTFDVGIGEVFIDSAEFNSERGIWVAQVSMTLDEAGRAIGSATAEVNLTELKRRMDMGIY